jgi:hypothetical protein
MGWLETIVLGVVLLAAGLYLLLAAAIVVTAMVERRPLKYLAPAELDDPEWQKLGSIASGRGAPGFAISDSNPYTAPGSSSFAESQISAAARLGFSASGLFKHSGGGIYKTYDVLMVSPSRAILAVVRWGTTGAIRNEACVLYSALEDGRYVVTSSRILGARAPGFYDDLVLLGADFDQLVGRHEQRLRASNQNARQFSPENPLAQYEAILENRARFLIAKGDAYWIDPDQTAFRSTLKGAIKMYALTLSTKHIDRSLSSAPVR